MRALTRVSHLLSLGAMMLVSWAMQAEDVRADDSLAGQQAPAAQIRLVGPAEGVGAVDSLAEPMRIETARDSRRISRDISLTVSITKTEFHLMEPVPVAVAARNTSNRYVQKSSIGFPPEAYYRVFRVKVFDGKGRLLPRTRYHDIDVPTRGMPVGGSLGSGALAPGRDIKGEVTANLVYDMTSPDDYTILIEFATGEVRQIDGQRVPLVAQSEPIPVRVIPDPPRIP